MVQWQHMVHTAQADGLFGHAEHHATGFILGCRDGSGFVHFFQTTCTIVAHAGHDHTDGIATGLCGDRPEQHIDRWSVMVDQRPIHYFR